MSITDWTPYLSSLKDPLVLALVVAVMGMVILLFLAVVRSTQNPTRRKSFSEALDIIAQSELDIDTALNTEKQAKRNWFEYWDLLTEESGKVVRDKRAPGLAVLGVMVFGAMFGLLVYPGGLMGLLVMPLAALGAARLWLGYERGKRVVAMEAQLPQLLAGMLANLQAGATPPQAVLSVADDMPSPLGDEMRTLKRDLNVNVPLEDALKGLAERVPSREMQFLVASIEIGVRSGSDLVPQLQTIQGIVTQRTRIRQKLKAAVAQVKPTQMLALGAVPLMMFVSMQNPENRAYWFGDGVFILAIGAILYLAGFAVIRTMVRSVENS